MDARFVEIDISSDEDEKRLNETRVGGGDDDDCVILDGDPNKAVAYESGDVKESDDVFIVGQKGQIACRDYPHPRHLCAEFPFASTPHERHCGLCHCYVCDSHAPCVNWGTGTSMVDHCHASDKEETWKIKRGRLKREAKLVNSTLLVGKLQANREFVSNFPFEKKMTLRPSRFQKMILSPSTRIHAPTNIGVSKVVGTAPSNICVSNVVGRSQRFGRSQGCGFVVPRNKFPAVCKHSKIIQKQRRRHNW